MFLFFCFQLCSLIFSIVSQSLLKTTQEPLPQDAVKRMWSFTGGGGRPGRSSTVHGCITPASSLSLHGSAFPEHLSFNKMFSSIALLVFMSNFARQLQMPGSEEWLNLFLIKICFQPCVVLLHPVHVTLSCFIWHHYPVSKCCQDATA